MTDIETPAQTYPRDRYVDDLKAMIEADAGHLADALAKGNRVIAHQYVDAIIDNRRKLEDLAR